jgi:hypothetical protein
MVRLRLVPVVSLFAARCVFAAAAFGPADMLASRVSLMRASP